MADVSERVPASPSYTIVTMPKASEKTTEQDWDEQARNWIAWARRPGFDSYWHYQEEFFQLVPEPGRATLDLGCGEGRVSRELKARGHHVTGIDVSPTLIKAAREADPDGRYLIADGAGLPFGGEEFDLVISYNVLMDVSDVAGTMREAARVLAKGGRFVLAMTHPITNAGRPLDGSQDAPFVLDGSYFEHRRVAFDVEDEGMRIRFSGWDRPLTAYTRALEDAGLLIEAIREPVSVTRDGTERSLPLHLWLRALRPPW
jgi:SAM-dependent methyltransferase